LKKRQPKDECADAVAVVTLRIRPRASKNEVVGMDDGGLKVRLTAPPVDGAANEALVRFLAERLGITLSRVELVSGHTGRQKTIRVSGMDETMVKRLLLGE
jgi:uncharacterized protein